MSRTKIGLLAVSAMVFACPPSPLPPPGEIILISDTSSPAVNVVVGRHTYALPTESLAPPSADPGGAMHTLIFNHAATPVPRHEVVAFDVDWAAPVFVPIPSEDYLS
jgi:hypothetical protein